MNKIGETPEYLNLNKILFEDIFQVESGEEVNDELELGNAVNSEKYPNLFYIVKSYIENINYLKGVYNKLINVNYLKDYEKEKIQSIHNSLFQDKFYLSYIQSIFNKYGKNIKNLEELDKELWKEWYINLLTYGNLIHCYEENWINWELLEEINENISIKIELEKKFHIEYWIKPEIDYTKIFDKDIDGFKKFFEENSNSKMDLSEKILYIDTENSSEYIQEKVKHELMYTLWCELRDQARTVLNESWLVNTIININKRWFNLNSNEVMEYLQEESKWLFQLLNSSDSITEKEDYNKELNKLDQIIKEINFSDEQIELIKIKFIPFVEEYINTIVFLKENDFQIEEEIESILDELLKKWEELDQILQNEWVFELASKLKLIYFLKENLEKEKLIKNIYTNIISNNYILVYNQILEYINKFWKDKNINFLKKHINIENIINGKIETIFQKLYNFENPEKIIDELEEIQSQFNDLWENNEISTKISEISIFWKNKYIELWRENLWINIKNLKLWNNYIKNRFWKWENILNKTIKLAIDWDSKSIDNLLKLKNFPFKIKKIEWFLEILEIIKEYKWNIIKEIIEWEKSLKKGVGTIFFRNLIREYIEEKKEIFILEIRKTIKWLNKTNIEETKTTIKWILKLEVWKEIEKSPIIWEINPEYLKYIWDELMNNWENSELLNLYKKLFLRKITIKNILENEKRLSKIINNQIFATNLYKVYKILKNTNADEIIILILEEYIITQDQKRMEEHLKDLFFS